MRLLAPGSSRRRDAASTAAEDGGATSYGAFEVSQAFDLAIASFQRLRRLAA